MDSLRGYSFYGLIPPKELSALVVRAGFAVQSVTLDEGSVYLWARSPEHTDKPPPFSIRESSENFQILPGDQ